MRNLLFILFISILFPTLLTAQHTRTEHWHKRIAQFNNETGAMDTNKVVFLGNSITEGFDLEKFFSESKPVNRGISGDYIDGLIERFDDSVLKLKPSKLFVMIGINDIGAGDSDSLVQANYQKLLRLMLQSLPNTRIYLQSILPTTAIWGNCPPDKIQRTNKFIQDFSTNFGFIWIDIFSKFATKDGYLRNDFTIDGLHLSSKGYAYWSTILKKHGLK